MTNLSKILKKTSYGLGLIALIMTIVSVFLPVVSISPYLLIGFIIVELIFIFCGIIFYDRLTLNQSKWFYWLSMGMLGVSTGLGISFYSLFNIILAVGFTVMLFFIMYELSKNNIIDFLKWKNYLFWLLVGSILLGLINIFIGSSLLHIGLTILLFFVFFIYIGFDIQRIMSMESQLDEKNIYLESFNMILNLLNLFLKVLEITSWFDND